MSTPARPAHSVSCSIAAALNVSAAARTTFFPLFLNCPASFPTEVVLPTPFTPISITTETSFSKSYAFSSTLICSLIESISSLRHTSISFIFCSLTFCLKFSMIFSVVATPISAIIRTSSSSS